MHNTVEQMKQLGYKYNEVELIRSDSTEPFKYRGNGKGSTKLTSSEWDSIVEKLTTMFHKPGA